MKLGYMETRQIFHEFFLILKYVFFFVSRRDGYYRPSKWFILAPAVFKLFPVAFYGKLAFVNRVKQ